MRQVSDGPDASAPLRDAGSSRPLPPETPAPLSLQTPFFLSAGVSCDACLKGNFRGRRFKCLICYDYDLCASCYESGATTTRHTTEHPMQCILTRVDYGNAGAVAALPTLEQAVRAAVPCVLADLYYGGDTFSVEQPQSFTCPYCGKMGFTETSLQDHVTSEHAETSTEVVSVVPAVTPDHLPSRTFGCGRESF